MILSTLIAASAAFTVQAQEPPETRDDDVLLSADRIYRAEQGGPMIADGDVRARSGTQFLRADRVVYDEVNDSIFAYGNVAVRSDTGEIYFAEEAQLSGDLANGLIEVFATELEPQGNLAAATVVRRESGRNDLRKATFTLCEVCDEGLRAGRPLWQLKARNVKQIEEKQVLRFSNAFLELFGVPLVYIPWLQVPDPSAERAAGFLAPQVGSSTRTGLEVEIPYHLPLSNYHDITFSPRYMSELGTLIQGEWRRNTHNSSAIIQAGVIQPTNDLSEEPGDPDDIRWHFYGSYLRQLPGDWNLDADIDFVSDKGYITTYDVPPAGQLRDEINIARPDRLESEVTFDKRTKNSFTDISAIMFQTLRFNEQQEFTAEALPHIKHRQTYKAFGGEIHWDGDFLVLNRDQGVDSMRASTSAIYAANHTTRSGHRFETFAELRGDAYAYRNTAAGIQSCNEEDGNFETCRELLPRGLSEDRFETYRFLPTIGAEWSYPLARLGQNTSVIIEPRIQAVISPDRDFSDDVFNEDSQFFQFDTVTLFDFSKASGLDQWEDGQRINVGLNTTTVLGSSFTVNTEFGAQFRAQETTSFNDDIGLGGTQSDYVGAVDLRIGRSISLENSFRVDKDTGSFRRLESAASGRFGPLSTAVNYLRVESDELADTELLDEFLTLGAALRVNRNISFAASQAQNLDAGSTANTQLSLRLQNNCAAVSIRYIFDDSTLDGFEQNRTILVKFDILGFN